MMWIAPLSGQGVIVELSEQQVTDIEHVVRSEIPGVNEVRIVEALPAPSGVVVAVWGNLVNGSTELIWLMDVVLEVGDE